VKKDAGGSKDWRPKRHPAGHHQDWRFLNGTHQAGDAAG